MCVCVCVSACVLCMLISRCVFLCVCAFYAHLSLCVSVCVLPMAQSAGRNVVLIFAHLVFTLAFYDGFDVRSRLSSQLWVWWDRERWRLCGVCVSKCVCKLVCVCVCVCACVCVCVSMCVCVSRIGII